MVNVPITDICPSVISIRFFDIDRSARVRSFAVCSMIIVEGNDVIVIE